MSNFIVVYLDTNMVPCDDKNNNLLHPDNQSMTKGIECDACGHINLFRTTKCGAKGCNARISSPPKQRKKRTIEKEHINKMRKMCKGKVTYHSMKQARAEAKKIQKETGRMSKIYGCKDCKGLHLTKRRS